ncbi:hypothetical protein [Burkholderia oklahomensis]|uniref:hypothetical protein n=1 Tax=Burkholderia oklahomensis TaxID=342113 RepID=UPI0005D8ED30|nr:hypothetical protein [Burkholderia oklahomensis]AJX33217.1 hypothetical protein BG90_104 [Burkholderia oklahomensis C6786]MBI0361080.1 hypothetical protein [Burkholderia oklahomensis]SUW60459.1 Uncharacterised protein [Burkholderia oklahomensis]
MKQILALLAAACAFTTVHAGTTCVYTKTKTLPNYSLALVHPVTVYKEPNVTSESKQITEVGAYYVIARTSSFIKLADARYYEKNPAYAFAGWAKKDDFDVVAYRNCVAASASE